MTFLQRRSLVRCLAVMHAGADSWYRAASSGERVTLASLYRKGLLVRRAWRGHAGEADAAYEYRADPRVKEVWDER